MAVGIRNNEGEFVPFFPGHDPDKMDEGLALEVAEAKALDTLIEATRKMLEMKAARSAWWDKESEMCWRALQAYDTAAAANRAHVSTWNEELRDEHYRSLLAEGWSDYEARAIVYEEPDAATMAMTQES